MGVRVKKETSLKIWNLAKRLVKMLVGKFFVWQKAEPGVLGLFSIIAGTGRGKKVAFEVM